MTTLNKKAAEVITGAFAQDAHVAPDAFVRPAEQSEASTAHVGTAAPGRPVEQSSTAKDGPSDGGRAALQGRVESPEMWGL